MRVFKTIDRGTLPANIPTSSIAKYYQTVRISELSFISKVLSDFIKYLKKVPSLKDNKMLRLLNRCKCPCFSLVITFQILEFPFFFFSFFPHH